MINAIFSPTCTAFLVAHARNGGGRAPCTVLLPEAAVKRCMTTHRTCSYTDSLIAVSWCLRSSATRHALTDVEIVADTVLGRSQIVVLVTVRLAKLGPRAYLAVDDRDPVRFDLVNRLSDGDVAPGYLFRHVRALSPDLHDGEPHSLRVEIKRGGLVVADHEMAFYARRAANRRLITAPPARVASRR